MLLSKPATDFAGPASLQTPLGDVSLALHIIVETRTKVPPYAGHSWHIHIHVHAHIFTRSKYLSRT
jgi:hypothetical protein